MKPKPMTRHRCAAILRAYNQWRRSNADAPAMPDPREIGRAIDFAVAQLEKPRAVSIR
jgi:hypothetical protein